MAAILRRSAVLLAVIINAAAFMNNTVNYEKIMKLMKKIMKLKEEE
jgi:hypothetical protein